MANGITKEVITPISEISTDEFNELYKYYDIPNPKEILDFCKIHEDLVEGLITVKPMIEKYFPGALTVISEKSDLTPFSVTSGKNTVWIRVPNNEFFSKLCDIIEGHVLATTSANLSNHPSSKSYEEAKKSIGNLVDIVFDDCGCKCKGIASTVILAKDDNIKILRQGCILPDV